MSINIGTAGWSIPRLCAGDFPAQGTSLSRYAARFPVVEINSSFHRPHRLSTWQRWRDSVPPAFRFSVKLPKLITHHRRLADCDDALEEFLSQVAELGSKLSVLLVQLPPKLAFDERLASGFFAALTSRTSAAIACEPRHPSWFGADADALLEASRIARVAADPAICAQAANPGGWPGLHYWRLHGSPVIYRSSYRDRIEDYVSRLEQNPARDTWCIFDNTAASAAAGDALALMSALERSSASVSGAR